MSAITASNVRKRVHALQGKLSNAAKQSLDRKFGALYDKMYREDVLMAAWLKVRANHGAPGVDRQDFEEIEKEIGVNEFLAEIREELCSYRYRPKAVLRRWIDKPGKAEKRPLGIPTIKDRVVQMAVVMVIGPIAKTGFDFLGVHFRLVPVHKPIPSRLKQMCLLWPSDKAIRNVKAKLRAIIGRRCSLSLEEIIADINPVIRGWSNYHRQHEGIWAKRRHFGGLNRYLYNRIRIFLRRKYNDQTRGLRRVLGNVPKQAGLALFG